MDLTGTEICGKVIETNITIMYIKLEIEFPEQEKYYIIINNIGNSSEIKINSLIKFTLPSALKNLLQRNKENNRDTYTISLRTFIITCFPELSQTGKHYKPLSYYHDKKTRAYYVTESSAIWDEYLAAEKAIIYNTYVNTTTSQSLPLPSEPDADEVSFKVIRRYNETSKILLKSFTPSYPDLCIVVDSIPDNLNKFTNNNIIKLKSVSRIPRNSSIDITQLVQNHSPRLLHQGEEYRYYTYFPSGLDKNKSTIIEYKSYPQNIIQNDISVTIRCTKVHISTNCANFCVEPTFNDSLTIEDLRKHNIENIKLFDYPDTIKFRPKNLYKINLHDIKQIFSEYTSNCLLIDCNSVNIETRITPYEVTRTAPPNSEHKSASNNNPNTPDKDKPHDNPTILPHSPSLEIESNSISDPPSKLDIGTPDSKSNQNARIDYISTIKNQLDKVTSEANYHRTRADKATTEIIKQKRYADEAKAEAEQARTDAEHARADAEQAKADAAQARADAKQARVEADQARADTEHARADAKQAKVEAEQAKEKIKNAQSTTKLREADIEELKNQLTKANTRIEIAEQQLAEAYSRIEQAETNAAQANSRAEEAELHLAEAKARANDAEQHAIKSEQTCPTHSRSDNKIIVQVPQSIHILPTKGITLINKVHAIVETVSNYLKDNGRLYTNDEIKNLILCISQSYMTIFAGRPGVGKSSLIKLLARALGLDNTLDNFQRYSEINVAKNWISNSDFIGYYNSFVHEFVGTEVYTAIQRLQNEEAENFPYWILLDEANLSSIEQYWSDFMNSCNIEEYDHDNSPKYLTIPGCGSFTLPNTLRFLATVNYDHTTQPLSERILDRSWVITLKPDATPQAFIRPKPITACTNMIVTNEVFHELLHAVDSADESSNAWKQCNAIHEFLYKNVLDEKHLNLLLSARLRNSICRYIYAASVIGMNENTITDNIISQRILPRVKLEVQLEEFDRITDFAQNKYPKTQSCIKRMRYCGESVGYFTFFNQF